MCGALRLAVEESMRVGVEPVAQLSCKDDDETGCASLAQGVCSSRRLTLITSCKVPGSRGQGGWKVCVGGGSVCEGGDPHHLSQGAGAKGPGRVGGGG